METAAPLPSWLHHSLARRRAGQLARIRHVHNQILAWRVQDSLAELGLSHQDYSIAGGLVVHIPQVISVSPGPPVRLIIRMLPGQRAENFTEHASAIAPYLGVARVKVVSLVHPLIQLELLPS
jgi:hypothetical protein